MKRDDLLRLLRRYARQRGVSFDVDRARGKGGHARLRLGEKVTTVQSGELSPFHVTRICRQLDVDPDEI